MNQLSVMTPPLAELPHPDATATAAMRPATASAIRLCRPAAILSSFGRRIASDLGGRYPCSLGSKRRLARDFRDGDDAALAGRAELDHARTSCEDRVVAADSRALAGPEPSAPLADDDLAAAYLLPGEHLDAEHLRVRVAAVPARAKSLLVRPYFSSFFAAGFRAAGFLAAGFLAAGFLAGAF